MANKRMTVNYLQNIIELRKKTVVCTKTRLRDPTHADYYQLLDVKSMYVFFFLLHTAYNVRFTIIIGHS